MQTTMNGHAKLDAEVEPPKPIVHVLKNYYIKEGVSEKIRFLSDQIYGIRTHYVGKKGYACKGEDCLPLHHKRGSTWKGYSPAMVWNPQLKLWFPCCFEMSEGLELDLRHRLRRGQVWECYRDLPVEGKPQPQRAVYVVGKDSMDIPPAFDVRGIVRSLYHLEVLPPSIKNPAADRVYLAPVTGDDPNDGKEDFTFEAQMTPQEYEELAKQRDRILKDRQQKNGHKK